MPRPLVSVPECTVIDADLDKTIRTALGYDLFPYVFPTKVQEHKYWWKRTITVDQVRISLFHYFRDCEAGRELREEKYPFLTENAISGKLCILCIRRILCTIVVVVRWG